MLCSDYCQWRQQQRRVRPTIARLSIPLTTSGAWPFRLSPPLAPVARHKIWKRIFIISKIPSVCDVNMEGADIARVVGILFFVSRLRPDELQVGQVVDISAPSATERSVRRRLTAGEVVEYRWRTLDQFNDT